MSSLSSRFANMHLWFASGRHGVFSYLTWPCAPFSFPTPVRPLVLHVVECQCRICSCPVHTAPSLYRHATMALWQEEASSERIDGRNDNVNCCNHSGTNSNNANNNTPSRFRSRSSTTTTPTEPGSPCRCFRCPGTGHSSPAQ